MVFGGVRWMSVWAKRHGTHRRGRTTVALAKSKRQIATRQNATKTPSSRLRWGKECAELVKSLLSGCQSNHRTTGERAGNRSCAKPQFPTTTTDIQQSNHGYNVDCTSPSMLVQELHPRPVPVAKRARFVLGLGVAPGCCCLHSTWSAIPQPARRQRGG